MLQKYLKFNPYKEEFLHSSVYILYFSVVSEILTQVCRRNGWRCHSTEQ